MLLLSKAQNKALIQYSSTLGKNKLSLCSSLILILSSLCVCAHLCPTLLDPMDCSLTRLLCPWDFSVKNTEWVAISSSRRSSQPRGSNPHPLHWQVGSLPLSHLGSPIFFIQQNKFYLSVNMVLEKVRKTSFSSNKIVLERKPFLMPWGLLS